jgi:hypothetical protein
MKKDEEGGGIKPNSHSLSGTVIRDKVVCNGPHSRLEDLRRDMNVTRLCRDGKDLSDVLLVRLEVLLEKGVEIKEQELMHCDQTRNEVHHSQSHFKLLI